MMPPRGSPAGWSRYTPVVPAFHRAAIGSWITGRTLPSTPGALATPGGYHTFENRWALGAAFAFHEAIGADRIAPAPSSWRPGSRTALRGSAT
jgi:hypothetical protein